MSPASPSVPSPDLLPQWKKRKRPDSSSPSSSAAAAAEVLPDSTPISTFPAALRRTLARPPPSLFAPRSLDNLSHGQLLSLSAAPPDDLFVCSPPPLLPSRGLLTHFRDLPLLLPAHAAWFHPDSVHRIERQVVPHYFSAKSPDQTPDRYILLRNTIISKYLEDPGRRLSYADCQGFVGASERYDLSRIVRFLDHWGIINYMAASMHVGLRTAPSLLKEDGGGELVLQTGPLRSIDSLVLFDRPKCSLSVEEVGAAGGDPGWEDLDSRIRERLSEFSCSCCSCPLPGLHYQSQKEGDVIICSNCFHDGKFVTGHSSGDFVRVDSKKDTTDLDGDNWTDQETFLLLEAVEKYNDNWNEIAEHVGTKSKAQCILHFLRLPMEDGVLERLEIPQVAVSADCSREHNPGLSSSNSNGDAAGFGLESFDPAKQLPFANSTNPVMSLVAFLASAVGPRVAAACASAALLVLTKGDTRLNSESIHTEVGSYGEHANHRKDETSEDQVSYTKKDAPLAIEHVKLAAMSGLSAAAMKSKLFADQEEREVQRLSATIITHQLKRLELKLKQFAEVETLLMKECEQVDRNRQRLSGERIRMMSSKFAGATGSMLPAAAGVSSSAAPASTSTRQTAMPSSVGQAGMPSAYGNNFPVQQQMPFVQRQQQMPFVQRQQQMFGYGPRLPLSAIHPSPSPAASNVIFGSGMANTSTSNHQRLLRSSSSSGNNTNIG